MWIPGGRNKGKKGLCFSADSSLLPKSSLQRCSLWVKGLTCDKRKHRVGGNAWWCVKICKCIISECHNIFNPLLGCSKCSLRCGHVGGSCRNTIEEKPMTRWSCLTLLQSFKKQISVYTGILTSQQGAYHVCRSARTISSHTQSLHP